MEETTTTAPESTSETTTEATTVNQEGTATSETTYLDGKYKSVSALEDGYKELQSSYSKKLGGFDGTPVDGYTYAEGTAGDETLETWGKDNQLSNDGMASMNEMLAKRDEALQEKQQADFQEYNKAQVELLGDNAQERIKNVTDFMKANTPITDEGLKNLNDGLFGANGIEVLEAMMKGANQTNVAQVVAAPVLDGDQLSAMQFEKDEQGNRRLSTDAAFRKKYDKLRADQHKAKS